MLRKIQAVFCAKKRHWRVNINNRGYFILSVGNYQLIRHII
jgi:hypothetical protein